MSIGLGILGFAHGHVGSYLNGWRQHPELGVRPVAGWDHDPARRTESCEKHELAACASAERLLGRDDVEAVVIAAETAHHADLAELAARAGKAIVMQKPLALTLEQADRIVAAVEEAGVPFTLAWQMRVDPQNEQIRRWVESGELGRIVMVRRRHGLSTHLWPWIADSWHSDPGLNRGMWADDAAHAIDFLLWLLGEPVSVMAEIDTLVNPDVPDDNGIAIFRYADGTIAEVVSSFTCPAGENTTEIVGTAGVVIQNFGDGPSCNVARPPGGIALKRFVQSAGAWEVSDLEAPPRHGHRIGHLAEPLAAFLRGERGPIADAAEGRTALKMTLACYDSAAQGRRIALS